MIRVLLSNTTLRVSFNGVMTDPFVSTIGSPQGDGLSPILFAIYLETALRALEQKTPSRPDVDLNLPSKAIYADDTDFISLVEQYLDKIQHTVGPIFAYYDLVVNVEKTERTSIGHSDLVPDQATWRKTKKLGSLLGVEEDIDRRIHLAYQAFKSLQILWKHRRYVNECIRINTYRVIVESVLLYNCATWALTEKLSERLDIAQRRMLRCILGIKWYDKMSNATLYKRCKIIPASLQVLNARWRMFGHTLRMHECTPAKQAMTSYFNETQTGRPGHRITIATALSKEYENTRGCKINNRQQYEAMVALASNRESWKQLVDDVVDQHVDKNEKKTERRRQTRRLRKHSSA